jgi:predicted nucleic acid-binding protein
VAVKWVIHEEHSEAAQRLLQSGIALTAPAHWLAEAATGLWGACRRGQLTEQQAYQRLIALVDAPLAVVPLEHLADVAMRIALRLGITIYDSLYLALAEYRNAILITADRRLYEAAHHDRHLRGRVRWIAGL